MYNNYLYIIKLILNNYNIYNKYNNTLEEVFKETSSDLTKLYYVIKEHYKTKQEPLSLDDYVVKFHASYPAMRDKERGVFQVLFDKLKSIEVNPDLVEEYLISLQKNVVANRLAIAATDYASGKCDFGRVTELVQTLENPTSPADWSDIEFVTDDLEALLAGQAYAQGLRWPLKSLNEALGSLRIGDFGFGFARPETGKTTFVSHTATHMAKQAVAQDLGPVAWFNNEEQNEKVKVRCFQSYFGVTLEELKLNRVGYGHRWKDEMAGALQFVNENKPNKQFVEKVISQIKPSLIIFDQIDKIEGFDADREDLKLGNIYIWARDIAKSVAPVIGICQADGSGEGVRYLTMSNVANAKTAKQAEADWILGIGMSHDVGEEYTRYFCISKNKLVGDEDTKPELRHAKWPVLIRPEIARYEDL